MNKQDQRPDNRDVAPTATPSQLADLSPKAEQTKQVSGGSGATLQVHGTLNVREDLNGNLQIADLTSV